MEKEQRKILLRCYLLGFISIILTPLTMYEVAKITKNLNEQIQIMINITIYIIGYYMIPTSTFWIADYKDLIENRKEKKKWKFLKNILKN